ncbi:MAG: PLP-dependent aminotransferase family protein [Actinomycetota bacterium]|nr:PLP-dependent aminotransferase family protein [Actinomycetota bacterium]
MSTAGRKDIVPFSGGLPSIEGLPKTEVISVMDSVLKNGLSEALQYGETEGRYPLKSALCKLMAREGLKGEPEHMLITTGSQQALDLISRILINPGDAIVTEGPTYVGALCAFTAAAPRVTTIPVDEEGMRVDLLEESLDRLQDTPPKFIYVIPNFHNPAGVTLSQSRRGKLVNIAEERDLLIIEDNPYGLLRFEGNPIEPITARSRKNVVYLGTLSKVVSPGIRVGWVLAPPPIIERLATLKQSADLCSPNLSQMFAEEYINRGLVEKNMENLKPVYRSRRDVMLSSLEEHLPSGCTWTKPRGGLFIWVTLPPYIDTRKMLPLAIEEKVSYVPGSAFFPDESGSNCMRLNFSYPAEEQIATGVKRLGKVIKKEINLYHSLGLDRE